ncbi:MAG TPA: ATP-binding protein [Solirubrobacteraceae bacterium]|nr:ATP-binding protein [Solirubrobacteraceae bacterium]
MGRPSDSPRLVDAPRSRALGLLLVVVAVTATTLAIYPLREIAPDVSPGVVYLLAVLLVAVYWGLRFGLLTSLASAAAFNFFHIPPTGRLMIADSAHWVALGVFLVAAVVASVIADLARTRAADAERRRAEADLSADTARVLLGGATLADAMPEAGRLVGAALGRPDVEIVLDPGGDVPARDGVVLDLGRGHRALLVLGAGRDDEAVRARVRARVAPALEALLRAALDRDRLQAEVVETQALRRSDVIKTALLRAVSHDLRTPLTAIITAGHAVRSPGLEGDERDELGAVVVEEAQRLSALVDKLLDLSRLQAGAAEPRRDWCSLEEVVRTAAGDVGPEDSAGFALSFDEDLPLVQADAAQLERVFVNVLENARRYSGGYPVKVRARVVGGKMSIRVIDRGPGMSPTQLERAFEPFYRDGASDNHPGAGLGLAIVRGFVEANGGRVRAESVPGQGTVVAIELPLAEEPAPTPATATTPTPSATQS